VELFRLSDLAAAAAPIGIFFGRIANFVNGELFGRVTDAPWGMVFPRGGELPRHPSQLYESFFEGLVLFIILFVMMKNEKIRNRPGIVSAAFLFLYGLFRFMIEYVRQPDEQLGFIIANLSMGQILCLPMMLGGIIVYYWSQKQCRKKEDECPL
jgi:phosphatidylglycerol:prolipoprotein diacylglycerol transferase